jgi:hypothetical protein
MWVGVEVDVGLDAADVVGVPVAAGEDAAGVEAGTVTVTILAGLLDEQAATSPSVVRQATTRPGKPIMATTVIGDPVHAR